MDFQMLEVRGERRRMAPESWPLKNRLLDYWRPGSSESSNPRILEAGWPESLQSSNLEAWIGVEWMVKFSHARRLEGSADSKKCFTVPVKNKYVV